MKDLCIQTHRSTLAPLCIACFLFMIPVSSRGALGVLIAFLATWLLSHPFERPCAAWLWTPMTRVIFLFFAVFLLGACYARAPPRDIFVFLEKMTKLLYFPLIASVMITSLWRRIALQAFVGSMLLTLCLALLKVHFQIPVGDPIFVLNNASVFLYHIDTNLLMACAVFITAHLCAEVAKPWRVALYTLLLIGMIYYILWMSEGRTGYIIFAMLWVLFFVQHMGAKGLVTGISSLIILLLIASLYAPVFQSRVIAMGHGSAFIPRAPTEGDQSIRERIEFARETWTLGMEKPWLGWGTGSFNSVYKAHVLKHKLRMTGNPHNEYLNIFFQYGLLGLSVFVLFFYVLWKNTFFLPGFEKYIAQGMLAAQAVGCIGNAWLMEFTGGYFFITMLALCFGGYARTKHTHGYPSPLAGRGRRLPTKGGTHCRMRGVK